MLGAGVLRRERPVRLALHQQLPRSSSSRTPSSASPASATSSSSASASTRCGCGSIPTGSRRAASPRPTSSARCASRTCRWRPARSASRRRAPGRRYQISVRAVGRLDRAGRVREHHPQARAPTARWCGCKDVGRAELGAENYATDLRYNGRDAVGFGVLQLPTANALEVYRDVVAELERLSQRFPPGLKYRDRVRHDDGRLRVDPRGRDDAARGHRARHPRHVPVPAELADAR